MTYYSEPIRRYDIFKIKQYEGFGVIKKQFVSFVIISGTGWIIDFSIYCLLVMGAGLQVGTANAVSAFPAITFVFLISTNRTFVHRKSGLSVFSKYLIYLSYQAVVVISMSILCQIIYVVLGYHSFIKIETNLDIRLWIKFIITPFTMLCNFMFMKILVERK